MNAINKITNYISALFIALLVGFFYAQNIDTSLSEPGAILGIATFDGVDVAKRIAGFYKLIFLTGFLFAAVVVTFLNFNKLLRNPMSLPLAALGAILVMFSFFNPDNINVAIVVLVLLASVTIPIRNETHRLFYIVLSVSISIFISYFLRVTGMGFTLWLIIFLWAVVLVILLVLDNKTKFSNHVSKLYPLVMLPILEPLANETFLVLNQREVFVTTPIGWLIIFFLGLLTWLFVRIRFVSNNQNFSERRFDYLFVISLVIFSLYKPFYSFWGDLFELANPANAMMRHFVFNELPFVDYFSSHVLFEQIPQWVYVVLNGYHADVSFMIYAFFVPVIGVLIAYWFFKRLLSIEWAFLVVLLFPLTEALIPPTFVFGLITIKLLYDYFSSRMTKKLYLLLFWILAITLWRIDFGASIIPAVVIIFVLEWVQKQSWSEIKTVLLHSVIFIVGLLGLAWLINISTGGNLFANLPLGLDYLGASQAHAYTELTKKFTLLFYLHYFVFPMISVSIIIHVWISNWKQESRLSFSEIATIFLGLFYLFNAQRGLVRHSFTEEYDLYISSVFFLFVMVWMLRFFGNNKPLKFMVFSFIFLLGFHYSNHAKPKSFIVSTLNKTVSAVGIKNTRNVIDRVKYNEDFDTEGYQLLSDFIDVNIKPNETFLDLSHTPMLYFLTQRKVPSYFNQYIQNTVTPKLLNTNVSRLKNIGMVIFGHSPRNPIDYLDGVPNELRYLPVTDYVYKNFKPYTTVNGYRIWMPKEREFVIEDSLRMLPVLKDDLRKWPGYLGKTTEFESVAMVILEGYEVMLFDHIASIYDALEVDFVNVPESANHNAWLQYYDGDNELLGQVKFTIYGNESSSKFVIPIGYQYNWSLKNVDEIKIQYPDYLTVKSINLVHYEP